MLLVITHAALFMSPKEEPHEVIQDGGLPIGSNMAQCLAKGRFNMWVEPPTVRLVDDTLFLWQIKWMQINRFI